MNKYIYRSMWFVVALLSLQVIASEKIFAGEMGSKNAAPIISNIGFMPPPPKELREKFPMCEAFLKVEWIDKEKRVGFSEYELYNQGNKINRVAHALVYLDDDHPILDANLDEFRKNGQ